MVDVIDWKGALPCKKWITYAREELKQFHTRETLVVTLVGKDFPNRKKHEELNEYLRLNAFPCRSNIKVECEPEVFYSVSHNIVFVVIDSPNDVVSLRNAFSEENKEKNFFEKLEVLERQYHRLLHYCSLISHLIVFTDPYPRIDMALVRTLKDVNRIRMNIQSDVIDWFETHSDEFISNRNGILVKQGRLAVPKFVFAFQKTVIRSELGHSKRKEIIDKLEESLEDQVFYVLKHCRLINTDRSANSLGAIPEKAKYVRLLNPSAANHHVMSDLLDFISDYGDSNDNDEERFSEIFSKLVDQNIIAIKREYNKNASIPELGTLIEIMNTTHILLEKEYEACSDQIVKREQKLLDEFTKLAIEDSVEQYSWSYGKERERVFTKAQHNQRFGAAVRYLDGLLVGARETVMNELRAKCDNLWQGGLQCCEQQSATGNICHLPVHSCVGDESVVENEWVMHDSGVTFISTCTCGRSQTLRRDPFSIKEANYDFYFNNNNFACCKAVEHHNFQVVGSFDEVTEPEEVWISEENWPRPGDEVQANPVARKGGGRAVDSQESISQESNTQSSSYSETDSSQDSDDSDVRRGTRRSYKSRGVGKETGERRQSVLSEYLKKVKELIPHTVGVPHSTASGILPVFPSWSLTCIGPGSLYSHAIGLRDQPNFKISSEYLLPVDIPLLVDRDSWEQDLEFVNAVEGVGMYAKYRPPKRPGVDTEKVKIFVGFDYECPRGHRFFVDSQGEPLLLPKSHSARDQACREAGATILAADLPLRRQCTCRKIPHQVAQLIKVHIVTPKSPVSVTIDPKIFLPNQEGYYCTGEAPLKLAWAKYYILHLPFVYDGPYGLWIPPKSFEKIGIFKGNSIQVTYTPLEKK